MAREIYYLTMNISTATAQNMSFGGEVHTYIHGKEDILLDADGNAYVTTHLLTPYWVRKYGYKTEAEAKRNWSYRNPENTQYWRTESRIIRAWVRKDNKVYIEP